MKNYLVFDVGGTFIKYAIMDSEGIIIEKSKMPTIVASGYKDEEIEHDINEFVNNLGKKYDEFKEKYNLDGIAVSLPGTIDVLSGIVYGGGTLTFLDQVPVGAMISKRCDDISVFLENDAKCAALAETWKGNAAGKKSAFVVVIGTGLGGGFVIDGHVFHGANLSAGEISFVIDGMTRPQIEVLHDVWGYRHIKTFEEKQRRSFLWCSNASARDLVFNVSLKKQIPFEELSGEKVFEMAAAGDEEVKEVLEDWYFAIAKVCINIKLMLDPEIILIGGGVSANPTLIDNVRKYFPEFSCVHPLFDNVNIEACKFRNDSNLIGALRNFMLMNGE